MIVKGVQAQDIETVWPKIQDTVEKLCLECGQFFLADDIKNYLINRDMQLWLALDGQYTIKALMITEIIVFPRKKACRVVFCTGQDAKEWKDFIALIEEWANQQYAVMQLLTRPGWEKLLKENGYKKTHVVLEKGE